jgi:small subunit ribosomal protein S9
MVTTKTTTKKEAAGERYFEAVGRRKTASARVRITPSSKESILINDKTLADYFQTEERQKIVKDAELSSGITQKFMITVHVEGGGIHAQAEAVRHGISRCLVSYDINLRGTLKKAGMLKRDSREVERKKPGLKKARKAPTWSKR